MDITGKVLLLTPVILPFAFLGAASPPTRGGDLITKEPNL